ncbi:tetratricopeptide repeat protein [Kitasatospora sp. NPDC059673]|uniref:tetratricopeptide repeat protein n=1 Tax=Kitasatospora sp. NPDC059673 TaxID=3346901 RepID=UPI0036A4DF25
MPLFTNRKLHRAGELLTATQHAHQEGRFGAAEEPAREAAKLYSGAGRPGLGGAVSSRAALGRALREQGRAAEAENELRTALARPGVAGTAEAVLRLELVDALWAGRRGEEALDEIGRAVAVSGPDDLRLTAGHARALLLGELGRHREAVSALAELADTARRLVPPQPEFALVVDSDRLAQLAWLGEHDEADIVALRVRAAAVTVAEPVAGPIRRWVGHNLAVSLSLRGRHTEAEGLLRKALAETVGTDRLVFLLRLGLSRALLGQGGIAAREAVETAGTIADTPPGITEQDLSLFGLAAATVHLALGQADAAEREAQQALTRCADAPSHRVLELRTALGIAELRQGRGTGPPAAAAEDWRAHFGEQPAAARQALAG